MEFNKTKSIAPKNICSKQLKTQSSERNSHFSSKKGFNHLIPNRYGRQNSKSHDTRRLETRTVDLPNKDVIKLDIDCNPKFAVFILFLIGNEVELKLNDNQTYRGIFHSMGTKEGSNERFICLRFCKRIFELFSDELSKPIEDYHMFSLSSINRLITTNLNGIPTNFDSVSGEIMGSHIEKIEAFKTDNEISSGSSYPKERLLKPWVPEENGLDTVDEILGCEPLKSWDQFEENRTKFGVKGTYDENLYTTPLNYDEISEEDKRNAEKLANEIENEQKKNMDGLYDIYNRSSVSNEEIHFSSVIRDVNECMKVDKINIYYSEDKVVGCNNESKLTKKHSQEINNSLNDIDATTHGKSGFSFNPNAKEFLPRSLLSNSRLPETNDDFNNHLIHETACISFIEQSDAFYYQNAINFDTNMHISNEESFHSRCDQLEIDPITANSKGTQFIIKSKNGIKEDIINHFCPDDGSLYDVTGNREQNVESARECQFQGVSYNNTINSQTIYFVPTEPLENHNSTYYIPEVSTVQWSNYPIQSQYYCTNNDPVYYDNCVNYPNQSPY
ncbi:polyadenylate-binding protein-interacting protein 4-like isoform X1 [Cryptosporidium felis]|nr:polyadenylate-binding protein-interacting protein 4-like isoform X1 [Cryptosporidium felis]